MREIPVGVAVAARGDKETFRVIAPVPVATEVRGLVEEMGMRVRLDPQVVRELRLPEYAELSPEVPLEMPGLGEMVGHKVAAAALETQ